MIHITHYDAVNGQRSARTALEMTVKDKEELEQLRQRLREQTGHDIMFVFKEKKTADT